MLNIVIFGAPGSGKGTQSDKLIDHYKLFHISTCDVLRDNIRRGTDLGKAAKGYIEGRRAPIVENGVQAMEAYINPIPAGLVLTGIVVSVSVSALMLALSVRLYRRYHTLNIDEITALSRREERPS